MLVGGRYGGQLESIPVSSMGRIKVVTVDYRMAPEHSYPAAEEDVIAVYRDLLKTYRAENIGIYGCSRSEEHTSELQSLMRMSYAVFCLKKKNLNTGTKQHQA